MAVEYDKDVVNATLDKSLFSVEGPEMAANVARMIGEGHNIKFTVFEKGTVFPEGMAGGMEHVQTWAVAYYIDGTRDWLFTQVKR